MISSQKAVDLILGFEGTDSPWVWPGDASGVTIGAGYDLGYEQKFESDWRGLISAADMNKLRPALGVRGERAHQLAKKMRGIIIPKASARTVFMETSLPREEATTARVFPGSETLPGDAFGALVSLIYNRGPLVDDSPRRSEMKALYLLFRGEKPYDLKKIADLVDSQKRLWKDVASSDGDLHDRRVAEANLIRSA